MSEPFPSCPLLDPADVHLWLLDTRRDVPTLDLCMAVLSGDEIDRCERLRSAHLRERFLRVHGGLRLLLGQYLNQPPEQIHTVAGPYGKPTLEPADAVQFNISYSAHMALLAFSLNRAVGVDIEQIQLLDADEMNALVARWFSREERDVWDHLAAVERLGAFYRLWSRKEAVIKTLGLGLSIPLDRFTVTFAPGMPARVEKIEECTGLDWQLFDIAPNDQFSAALAVEKPIRQIIRLKM